LIGTILDKYEVLQKVGEGGMATVYRGRHTTLDRDVAIKVLHPHLSSSTRNRKRFAREAKAIEHLHHDNVLEIFDYSGEDADECYIVTEFVHGQTLTEVMNRVGKMPSEVATMIGLDLAHALDAAHSAGILHRDLKPDNVMLRLDGTTKLMDFGIARFLDETQVTMTGALVGSPAFMSPEQAGEGKLDARSDLFSLGTALFYLVTGHLPFSGSNPSIVLKNIIEGNRPAVTELCPAMSASLADVIERLLQRDREARFDTAAQVIEALNAALAEVDIDRLQPEWRLVCWLADPGGFERRLETHLTRVLYDRGRELLAANDTLAALRLLNRLLSMDEDNEKVLALVQGLHDDPTPPVAHPAETRPRSWWPLALAAVLVTLGGGATTWALSRPSVAMPTIAKVPPVSPAPIAPAASADTVPPVPVQPAATLLHIPGVAVSTHPPGPKTLHPVVRSEDPPVAPLIVPQPPPVETGWLVILPTAPKEAELQCDDNKASLGSTKKRLRVSLTAGKHTCKVSNNGYEPVEFDVELSPNGEVQKKVDLRPLPAPVQITCPEDCDLYIDGNREARIGDLKVVAEGTWQYQLSDPDHDHQLDVRCKGRSVPVIANGADAKLSPLLAPEFRHAVGCAQ
jgi:tRNA A-37 threonylcarbamoyl transferase component Bud32